MNRMPAIIQLPINEPGTPTTLYAANGAGGDHAPSPLIDDRLQRNPFALLDDTELVERQRLRLREAFWISLITHGVLIILFLVAAPHLVRTRVAEEGHSNRFATALAPGARIEQAARAAAENRGAGSVGAFGTGISPQATNLHSNIGVLSDTMGVDFGPYLSRVLHDIKRNWYNLIPEEARAPLMKQGKVIIRFVITKNGGIAGMKVLGPSGDVALDRAAYGGISNSNPFQPLPNEFRGEYLALACTFYYNPDRNDLR